MPTTTPAAQPSDAFLLARAAKGDAHAYQLVYNRYRRPALALAVRLCGHRGVAEEVVQEAFLTVWRRAGTYEESRGSACGWILTIVRNRGIDDNRRRGRSERSQTELDGLEEQLAGPMLTDVQAHRREHIHAIHEGLSRLPAPQREALILTHFRGLTHHETATVIGRSLGTVKGRIRLGHARLARDLATVGGAAS